MIEKDLHMRTIRGDGTIPIGPGPHKEVKEGAIWVEILHGIGRYVNPEDPEHKDLKERIESQEREHAEVMDTLRADMKRRIELLKNRFNEQRSEAEDSGGNA